MTEHIYPPLPTILPWKLLSHSYQIADTGDYDGCYEITNGKISIFTKDDEDTALSPIVDALNNSGAKFYLDDSLQFENHLLKLELDELRKRLNQNAKNPAPELPQCLCSQPPVIKEDNAGRKVCSVCGTFINYKPNPIDFY